MPAYSTPEKMAAGFRKLSADEIKKAAALLEEAAVIIDQACKDADSRVKEVVSNRMVRRAMIDTNNIPLGATQASMAGMGFSQSWMYPSGSGSGSSGELYLSRVEKSMLHIGDKIGARSPLED